MKRRYKVVGSIAVVAAVLILVLGAALRHDAPCGAAPPLAAGATPMKGVAQRCYGAPETLIFGNLAKPVPTDDEVLVRVHAAAANPLDWHYMRGEPRIMRLSSGFGAPKEPRFGVDFAGTVEAVGARVTRFKPGDAVYGGRTGAFAEYVTVRESRAIAHKPDNVGFAQAAAVPIAALTALQGLRDKGRLQPGQKVLVNGASGGVGSFAVQIAKAMGAEVTGVCSTRNVELVRSLGADHVIDYTRENFTEGGARYDLVLDMVGNQPLLDVRRVMTPDGVYVEVGGPNEGKWLGPLTRSLRTMLLAPFVSQDFVTLLAELTPADLAVMNSLLQSGKVTPLIDRHYPLAETAAAIAYLEEGRARGKVIIDVGG
jgi:NADPH:quinone reductase-like Zn-dependent oxidoreductase